MMMLYLIVLAIEVLGLALFIVGIVAMVRGQLAIVSGPPAKGVSARVAAAFLMLTLPLPWGGRILVESSLKPRTDLSSFQRFNETNDWTGEARARSELLGSMTQIGLFTICMVAAVVTT